MRYLVALGLAMFAAAMAMATAVDRGFTRGWPEAGRTAWAIVLIALVLGGVLTFAWGTGVIHDRTEAIRPGEIGPGRWVAVYVGILVLGVAGAMVLEALTGVDSGTGILLICGAVFMLAASGRPWWLYATIRRTGWFLGISSDGWMRILLLALGVGMLLAGGHAIAERP